MSPAYSSIDRGRCEERMQGVSWSRRELFGGGGATEVLRELRGCADDLFPGETVLVHGCTEDLFPGRDCSGARLHGISVPREKLY